MGVGGEALQKGAKVAKVLEGEGLPAGTALLEEPQRERMKVRKT